MTRRWDIKLSQCKTEAFQVPSTAALPTPRAAVSHELRLAKHHMGHTSFGELCAAFGQRCGNSFGMLPGITAGSCAMKACTCRRREGGLQPLPGTFEPLEICFSERHDRTEGLTVVLCVITCRRRRAAQRKPRAASRQSPASHALPRCRRTARRRGAPARW